MADPTRWLALFDQAVVSLASFATSIIVGRAGGQEQLGLYLLALTIMGVVVELQEVCIWYPYTFHYPRLAGLERQYYTGAVLVHQVAFSFFSLPLLGALAMARAWGWGPAGLETVLWPLIFWSVVIYFQEFSRRICFANLRMAAALGFDGLAGAIRIGGLLILAHLGDLTAGQALAVAGLAAVTAGFVWLLWARPLMAFSWPDTVSAWERNWPVGKWMLAGNLALMISQNAFPWFLAVFSGVGQLGVLAACQGVVALTNPLLVASRNFLAPRAAQVFTHGSPLAQRRFVRANTLLISTAVGGVSVGIMVWGSQLLHLLYGPHYGDPGAVIMLLAAGAVINALPLVMDYAIWAMGRPDINFRINLGRLALTLTAGLLLVSRLEIWGAALGYLLGSVLVLGLQSLAYVKLMRERRE